MIFYADNIILCPTMVKTGSTHFLSDQLDFERAGWRHLLKVALGDHTLALRNDVEIGFVPPAMAHGNGGHVADLVGPRLTCGPTPPA